MNFIYQAAAVSGAWDITSFLNNVTAKFGFWGGLALGIFGAIGLVWGAIMVWKKLAGNQPPGQGPGWGKMIGLILFSGAISTGGFNLMQTVSGGGKTSLLELGGGTALVHNLDSALPLLAALGLG